MKPIKATTQDTDALVELGRASVQIIHDLKNQVNGLKLYATFLRKRMERSERPQDELETINKIMAGLERAATDMNTLVRFGRPVELQPQPRLDLAALLASATEGDFAPQANDGDDDDGGDYRGDFDAPLLSDALKSIHAAARGLAPKDAAPTVNLGREENGASAPFALVEWRGLKTASDGEDIFTSFNGGAGLRLALAAKVITAHGGTVEQAADALRVRLPLGKDEG